MKRKEFLSLTSLIPVAIASSAMAQQELGEEGKPVRPPRRKGTAADIREMDASVEEKPFTLSSLSAAEQRKALHIADVMSVLIFKVFLSRKDSASYPLSRNTASLERQVDAAIGSFSPKTLARLDRVTRNPAALKKKLRNLGDVDLKAELTPKALRLPTRSSRDNEVLSASQTRLCATSARKYTRVNLLLRRLRCVDETNPESGSDDMIVGGLIVGASGNVGTMNSVVCGEFDDGDMADFSYPIGKYSLTSTNTYPKTFYAIFQLVESDSNDAEVAQDLKRAMRKVADMVLASFPGASPGQMAGAVIDVLHMVLDLLLDEDYFPCYAIQMTLHSQNDFGGSMSDYRRTGEIRGHDGVYRIGYRWLLTYA